MFRSPEELAFFMVPAGTVANREDPPVIRFLLYHWKMSHQLMLCPVHPYSKALGKVVDVSSYEIPMTALVFDG